MAQREPFNCSAAAPKGTLYYEFTKALSSRDFYRAFTFLVRPIEASAFAH